uniref:Uncharacterized protein n=1 Tax=Aplanochytrium stocchinoi TaxID=215587 RepID=A0A7S3LN88_9STRA|mmetsp:Transcript_7436/g.9748  ORF Transcript_7436/g.9748 Transcript_7436/m.9748 type:complete len:202 (+) Transcript_7436:353-958(+)|eukprot:CAMPEP_0204844462 /NCGR_PEP_ID=MMETSP1347-20130617/233_1 /ASSEMBLY_ACC=CAM_ASM_000690 /TAXON_ID=215587 /ORGANISM="Aplanochytrium stocchinoi, Strain GSBS06" /LENGTH=201 /DNA_ID=CAMNT_0051983831 /DNA_START=78 /DNA_END=683 /DNA_ORIENTATION=-
MERSNSTFSDSSANARPRQTTYEIFSQFVVYDKRGNVDTSAIFDKECFHAWLATRNRAPKKSGESFRRALVSQLTASDGRKPFPPEVEESILKNLRQKKVWPCFEGTKTTIGIQGFKREGYHEKQRKHDASVPFPKEELEKPQVYNDLKIIDPYYFDFGLVPAEEIKGQFAYYDDNMDISEDFSRLLNEPIHFLEDPMLIL